ncbi:DUF2243 domain-containing protein [Allorhodopirellula solitaria]|uniref:DUF2243 domain-containing protein n=1 Tax=Allorhodopirellula solitaria TaxID=2527987 RepID=A0A5C5WL86_9BACT|nr:DUF2243 domain-containing protein [Allorhodopirellula solitaria]TWT51556.1 hypothetical protein CA85_52490 [Allorhodopirellula solitaria]
MNNRMNRRPLISAGTMMGIGMGGFVDGILFHQLLQFHNMLSAKLPVRDVDMRTLAINLEINMFWDGLFHVFTWIMTAVGIAMLWHAVRQENVPRSTRTFVGSLSLGWGLFNLVEGVIDHHILHIHHVTETSGHLLWDLIFLGSGVALILLGWWLIHSDPIKVDQPGYHAET